MRKDMEAGGRERPEKSPEELAQIAFLDDLRFGRGGGGSASIAAR